METRTLNEQEVTHPLPAGLRPRLFVDGPREAGHGAV